MSQRFGARTAQGSAALEQARGFELYLRTAEKEQLRFEEGVDIFSRYLPYAMIFGVTHRWTKLFAQLGAEGRNLANTSWYQGADLYHSTGSFYTSLGSFSQDFSYSMAQAAAATAWSASNSSSGGSGFPRWQLQRRLRFLRRRWFLWRRLQRRLVVVIATSAVCVHLQRWLGYGSGHIRLGGTAARPPSGLRRSAHSGQPQGSGRDGRPAWAGLSQLLVQFSEQWCRLGQRGTRNMDRRCHDACWEA